METIDQELLGKTIIIGDRFDQAAIRLEAARDHRVFFTWAHGYITKKIYKHIKLFNKPNELMRLNQLFANKFLDAINGNPSPGWIKAFRVCSGLDNARSVGFVENLSFSTGSYEMCAACMVKIHINQDLHFALTQVKDVDPQDYGNVLILVTEGHFYAEKRLRGRLGATVNVMLAIPAMSKLNMNAEVWRNQAFESVRGIKVPPPSSDFATAYQKAEGRR